MSTTRTIILLMLCINIMLYLGGFTLVDIGGSNMLEQFVEFDAEGNPIGVGEVQEKLPQKEEGLISGFLNVVTNAIDPILMIGKFFAFLINISFAPIAIFFIPDMPIIVIFALGIPLMAMYALGLVWFIRGGND